MKGIPDMLIETLQVLDDDKVAVLDAEIAHRAEEDEDARRLKTVPGFGPVTAAASALAPRLRLLREHATSSPGWN
jgi:transposase